MAQQMDFGDAIVAVVEVEREKFAVVKASLGYVYTSLAKDYPTANAPKDKEAKLVTKDEFFAEFVLILRLHVPTSQNLVALKVTEATPDTLTGYMRLPSGDFGKELETFNPDQIISFSISR